MAADVHALTTAQELQVSERIITQWDENGWFTMMEEDVVGEAQLQAWLFVPFYEGSAVEVQCAQVLDHVSWNCERVVLYPDTDSPGQIGLHCTHGGYMSPQGHKSC